MPSFSNSQLSASNSRPSFWFSLKSSKGWASVWKAWGSVSTARPCVLKKNFGRVFRSTDTFLKIWSLKSSLHTSHLIKVLNSWQSFAYLLSILNLPFSLNLFLFRSFPFQILTITSKFRYFIQVINLANWDVTGLVP